MKMNFNHSLLKKLTDVSGPSGHEDPVRNLVVKTLEPHKLPISFDGLGSISFRLNPLNDKKPKVLLLAHMDEVGFLAFDVNSAGFIKVAPTGGFIPHVVVGSEIQILNKLTKQTYYGVVSTLSPHNFSPGTKLAVDELLFDFGFQDRKDALKHINLGDPITFTNSYRKLPNNRVKSKALDDRLGCLLALSIAQELAHKKLGVDLEVGFSVQEEVGLRGAQTIANTKNFSFAIISDVSPADDYTGDKSAMGQLGAGTIVRVMDRGHIANPRILNWQKKLLAKNKIPHQFFFSPGGTDAYSVHLQKSGIPTLQTTMIGRNLHSAASVIAVSDWIATYEMALAAIQDLNAEKIAEFTR